MSKGGSHYVQHPAGETGDSNGEPLLFSANPKKIKYNTSFSMNAHHSMSRHYWLHYCCTFFFFFLPEGKFKTGMGKTGCCLWKVQG